MWQQCASEILQTYGGISGERMGDKEIHPMLSQEGSLREQKQWEERGQKLLQDKGNAQHAQMTNKEVEEGVTEEKTAQYLHVGQDGDGDSQEMRR